MTRALSFPKHGVTFTAVVQGTHYKTTDGRFSAVKVWKSDRAYMVFDDKREVGHAMTLSSAAKLVANARKVG